MPNLTGPCKGGCAFLFTSIDEFQARKDLLRLNTAKDVDVRQTFRVKLLRNLGCVDNEDLGLEVEAIEGEHGEVHVLLRDHGHTNLLLRGLLGVVGVDVLGNLSLFRLRLDLELRSLLSGGWVAAKVVQEVGE
ncbi:hypothetical protein HG531_012655 [Fusarium graminearum]|nr:hypothetical protein HG531_012655 [Fusarium graminearum]